MPARFSVPGLVAAVSLAFAGTLAPAAYAAPSSALAPGSAAVANPDGTRTVTLDLAGDTWVSSSGQTASQSTSPELRVGSNNLGIVKSRSYLDFDYTPLAAIPSGAVISSARLTLSDFAAATCTGTAIRAARITGSWTLAGVKWGAQPAVTTLGSGTSTAAYGASACPAEGLASFDVTGIVTSWIGGSARRGIQVKADNEGAASGYRRYRSAENGDAAKAPTLTVTYDSYPATASKVSATPGNTGYVTSLTPTLAATVSDPDGGAVRGYFEVRKGTTPSSPVVWSGTSAPVDSGSQASVTMPAGVLAEGSVYSVAAWGYDGTLKSTAPAVTGFKVDTTAPDVAISSDVFTDGAWTNPMPTSSTFTLDGSPDASGFRITFDGTVLPDVPADSNGDYTSTWKPVAGWHVISVVVADKAGNVSTPRTFSFGTGTPAFALPTEWEGSTSDFPVSMSAPPNAVKAGLLWRPAGDPTWHVATHLDSQAGPWDGSVTNDGGHATTGLLTWHATAESLGTGTLTAPALVQVRGCFQYPSGAIACTADRYVQLVSAQ